MFVVRLTNLSQDLNSPGVTHQAKTYQSIHCMYIIRKIPSLLAVAILLLTYTVSAAGGVVCREYDEYILTHQLTPAGPVPTAVDPNGV